MEQIRKIQKRYCSTALAVAIFAALLFFLAGQKPVGKGLILGTLFSILNFILMGETLPMRLLKARGKTFLVSIGSISVRYLLLAVPLVVAIKVEQFNLIAAIWGIFMIQFVILSEHFFSAFTNLRNNHS